MNFFQEYFINPIINASGYNPVNTTVYGLILIIAVYLIFKLLKKLDIKIDRYFSISLLPFIILGGLVRVLEDAEVLTSYLFVSPLVYFMIFFVTLASLFSSILIEKKFGIKYYKPFFAIGLSILLYSLIFIELVNLVAVTIILLITVAWFGGFLLINYLKPKILSMQNSLVLGGHMLDASATFTALSFFGYWEQHVLPSFFIDLFGPVSFFILKLAVLIPVLFLVDRYVENEEEKNWLKLIILVLGLAPGVRDMTRLGMGV